MLCLVRSVVPNLGGDPLWSNHPFTGVAFQIACMSDTYITIHTSSKIIITKIILLWRGGVVTTWGTVLKGRRVRKVENHELEVGCEFASNPVFLVLTLFVLCDSLGFLLIGEAEKCFKLLFSNKTNSSFPRQFLSSGQSVCAFAHHFQGIVCPSLSVNLLLVNEQPAGQISEGPN